MPISLLQFASFLKHICISSMLVLFLGFSFFLNAQGVRASSSSWHETGMIRMRLVTSGLPTKEGHLKGALDIRMQPGWKTYWRDPGASGSPPSVTLVKGKVTDIGFPPPEWGTDSYLYSAIYRDSIMLPIRFSLSGTRTLPLQARVFLVLCKIMCIPVHTTLVVDPYAEPHHLLDTKTVQQAFEKLAPKAFESFRILLESFDGKKLKLDALCPDDCADAELFIAGTEKGYTLGKPVLFMENGKASFILDVLSKPSSPLRQGEEGPVYVLKTKSGSVSGTIPYF